MIAQHTHDGVTVRLTPLHAIIGPNAIGKKRWLHEMAYARDVTVGAMPEIQWMTSRAGWPPIVSEFHRRFPALARAPITGDGVARRVLQLMTFELSRIEAPERAMLILSDPTRGMHPMMAPAVMSILRAIVERGWQVFVTTHDPLLVNEFQAHEVTIMARVDDRLHAMPISETPHFHERAKVYNLGELWVSHLMDEPALFGAMPREG